MLFITSLTTGEGLLQRSPPPPRLVLLDYYFLLTAIFLREHTSHHMRQCSRLSILMPAMAKPLIKEVCTKASRWYFRQDSPLQCKVLHSNNHRVELCSKNAMLETWKSSIQSHHSQADLAVTESSMNSRGPPETSVLRPYRAHCEMWSLGIFLVSS